MSTDKEQPIDAEVVPPTQALAVKDKEQAVVNPLDLDPGLFRSGLDRRKENRKHLIEWVREALVEGTDFGRIPTKRGPSKPSLWKPGAEKICGMLGVTPTFPTLKLYEDAALDGKEIKVIVLRCEIVNSSGGVIAHGIGCRTLEQDYGDINKAMKMAEKSAHIDATLRMAGLSEIFTQDIEDMVKAPQDAPRDQRPVHDTTQTPKATGSPVPVRIPASPEQCLEKFIKNIDEAGARERATQFLIDLAWLLPTEKMEDMKVKYAPRTKDEYIAFLAKLTSWAASGKPVKPYDPHSDEDMKQDDPKPEPEKTSGMAVAEPWYGFIIPVPHKGERREDYLKHPETIGMLYERRHGQDEESQASRQRLWGFVNHYEAKGREFKGKKYPPTESDIKFRKMLDLFSEWFQKNHPEEEL